MKRFAMIATLMLASSVTAARAEPIADQVVQALTDQGYTRIEIKNRAGQIKVEAIRGANQLEVVYDAQTGAILSQESHPVRAGDDTTPGVSVTDDDGEVRVRGQSEDHRQDDFGHAQAEANRNNHSGDDGVEDDSNDDNGSDDVSDDSNDDHGSDDVSDDSNDDNGSDDASDDSNDDHGNGKSGKSGKGGNRGSDDGDD